MNSSWKKSNLRHPLEIFDFIEEYLKISGSRSDSLASGGINLHEVAEDRKALSRLWELYGGLLKKHRLVHSSVEMVSYYNSI